MRIKKSFIYCLYSKVQKKTRQLLLLSLTALSACSVSQPFTEPDIQGVVGASDILVQKAGMDMLSQGGNAADAMAAMLFMGSVTLPSRMGLASGGVCQVLDPTIGRVRTLNFLSTPANEAQTLGVPAMPRGVFSLQNQYGVKRWSEVLSPAIAAAQNGITVSDVLAKDILSTQGLDSSWRSLKKSDRLVQRELAQTLKTISISGSGVLYNGVLSQKLISQHPSVSASTLKSYRATFMDSIDVSIPKGKTYFANPSVLSYEGYSTWKDLTNTTDFSKVRGARESIRAMEERANTKNMTGVGLLAADKSGLVVVCSVSMGRSFGAGLSVEGGYMLADAMSREQMGTVIANILHTNPDVTDAYYVSAGVGDYATVDGLSMMESTLIGSEDIALSLNARRQNALEQGKDDLNAFVLMKCERGYPNEVSTCVGSENIKTVHVKE